MGRHLWISAQLTRLLRLALGHGHKFISGAATGSLKSPASATAEFSGIGRTSSLSSGRSYAELEVVLLRDSHLVKHEVMVESGAGPKLGESWRASRPGLQFRLSSMTLVPFSERNSAALLISGESICAPFC